MKKLFLCLISLLLVACSSPPKYNQISENTVDGYYIYKLEHEGLFCNTYYEEIYFSDKIYNYGFSFYGCSPSMTYYIIEDGEYIYLQEAINSGLLSLESLIPELTKFSRHPEEISIDKADYYWLDFHIFGKVVYAYAGGDCNTTATETFIISGKTYTYSATGCLKENILFIEVDKEMIPVSQLLIEGKIDGKYLIPLLEEQ